MSPWRIKNGKKIVRFWQFRSIKTYCVALICVGGAVQALAEDRPPDSEGRFRAIPEALREQMFGENAESIEQLEAIGYLGGIMESEGFSNVTVHDKERAQPGLNFFTSGHAPEAYLTDMEGNVVHQWECSFDRAFPNYHIPRRHHGMQYWRMARLLPDGSVLAIFEGRAIIKVDKDSKVLWSVRNNAHHDLDMDEEGNIYVLTREGHIMRDLNPRHPILEDFVSIMSPDGNCLRRISLIRAFMNSEFADIWHERPDRRGDAFHTNSLELLDGSVVNRDPAFRKGNILLSPRNMHLIMVLDPWEEKIVWIHRGDFFGQHDPKILENGNLLLFDNGRRSQGSRIHEFSLATMDIVWQYPGGVEAEFKTPTCGSAFRLPNGNTLICESDPGRGFEVTPEKEIVWEFYNPHLTGDNNEFIATLFNIERIDPAYVESWLER